VTRFIHDQFAKQYLSELLSPLGTVEANKEVSSEVRYIDLFFTPFDGENPRRDELGLLGRLTNTPALFEPFRNPVSKNEIRTCLLKLLTLQQEWERQANRNQARISEDQLPRLWILTPTASANLLESCNAVANEAGIYFCGDIFKTAFIVIHQLPVTPETLWLRLLGRGSVQRQAVLELEALSPDLPLPKILGLKPRPSRTALYYNIGVRVTSNVGRTTTNLTNSIVKVRGFQHNPC